MHHALKIWPENFDALASGARTADLRVNDRGFAVGDTISYAVWDPASGKYDGRGVDVVITHLQGLADLEPALRSALGLNPSFDAVNKLAVLSVQRTDLLDHGTPLVFFP